MLHLNNLTHTFARADLRPEEWQLAANFAYASSADQDPLRASLAVAHRKITPHWPGWRGPQYVVVAAADLDLLPQTYTRCSDGFIAWIDLAALTDAERDALPSAISNDTMQQLADYGIDPQCSRVWGSDDPRAQGQPLGDTSHITVAPMPSYGTPQPTEPPADIATPPEHEVPGRVANLEGEVRALREQFTEEKARRRLIFAALLDLSVAIREIEE